MNILHVVPEFNIKSGGVAYALKNIVESLNKFHVDSTILTSGDVDLDVDCEILLNFPATGKFKSPRGFNEWLNDNITKFDLVHIHSIWLFHSRAAAYYCKKYNIPYVISPCGMLDDWSVSQKKLKKLVYYHIIEKSILLNAKSIHCTLPIEAKSHLLSKVQINKEIIELPTEDFFFDECAFSKANKQFLFLGRFHYKKQPELVIEAFQKMQKFETEWTLKMAGSGDKDFEGYLKSLSKTNENIKFTGVVSGINKLKLFQESSFFVLPSLQENYGVAVAEAICSGAIPIISNEVALSSIVEENGLGLICKPNLNSLSEKIKEAIGMSEIRQEELSQKCIDFGRKHFSQQALGPKYKNYYESIISA